MTPDGIERLAIDIVDGKVFGSWDIPDGGVDLLASIFLPIKFGALDGRDSDEVAHVYEYLEWAGPRAADGHPVFSSMRTLGRVEAVALLDEVERRRGLRSGHSTVGQVGGMP
jgi:hypothetical protein